MKSSQMKIGEVGIIKSVLGEGALRHRLLEMGLIPGTRITLIKKAPLGDPLQFRVRSFEISVRKDDAEMIEMEEH